MPLHACPCVNHLPFAYLNLLSTFLSGVSVSIHCNSIHCAGMKIFSWVVQQDVLFRLRIVSETSIFYKHQKAASNRDSDETEKNILLSNGPGYSIRPSLAPISECGFNLWLHNITTISFI